MIDVVSSITGGGAQYKQPSAPRAQIPAASPPPVIQAPSQAMRIRVDNQLDMAIIEYRSSDTGELMHQYPTEAQVKAMARAAELENSRPEQSMPEDASPGAYETSVTTDSSDADADVPDVPDVAIDIPAPQATYAAPAAAVATAAPAVTAAPALSTGSTSASSTQSITV